MIKAVIFDLGGVIFQDGSKYAIQEMKEKFGFSEELANELVRGKKSKDFRNDLITADEFWSYVQTKIPTNVSHLKIRSIWYDNYQLNPGIFELLKKLKTDYKLGIISGNIRERVEYLDKKYDYRKFFDTEIYSFNLHVNKPDVKMWKKAIELIDLKPEVCIYIDDFIDFVNIANYLGFKTIHFKDAQQLESELKRFGVKL